MAALRKGKSLLPAGVTAVIGDFDKGDCVQITDPDGVVIGVGLAAYPADEAFRIRGRRSDEIQLLLGHRGPAALIHRDDLVLDKR